MVSRTSATFDLDGRSADVDVCVCTFKRDSIVETLRSLGGLVLPDRISIRVIVADNDVEPSARSKVIEAGREAGLNLTYVHAPARNISIARNACLASSDAPLIAFIDDDEVASPIWLASLLSEASASQAAIILGPVKAQYRPGAPRWLAAADVHSTRPAFRRDGAIDTGYSCNVLLKRAILDGAIFDERLGRSGGEDDVFFSRLHRNGARIAYSPDAIVFEDVPRARERLPWLLRRSFRNGQTFAEIRMADGVNRTALTASSLMKAIYCGGLVAAGLPFAERWRAALVRGALHSGAFSRLVGKRTLELY